MEKLAHTTFKHVKGHRLMVVQGISECQVITQSINQLIKIYIAPLQHPYSEALRPRPSGKQQSSKAGETENRQHLGGASDLRETHSRLLDQLQKANGSALSQSHNRDIRDIIHPLDDGWTMNHWQQNTSLNVFLHCKRLPL